MQKELEKAAIQPPKPLDEEGLDRAQDLIAKYEEARLTVKDRRMLGALKELVKVQAGDGSAQPTRQLVSLTKLIQAGDDGYPHSVPDLAVAKVKRSNKRLWCGKTERRLAFRHNRFTLRMTFLRLWRGLTFQPRDGFSIMRRWRTTVPYIPPYLRAGLKRNDLIVFEATWVPEHVNRDPAILRQVNGDVYEVIAIYDLSDIEATALRQSGIQ